MKTDFQYKNSDLSEEHIRQLCRFLDKPYIKAEYQKWHKFAVFKWWHKKLMDKRDAELALKKDKSKKSS